MVLLFFKETSDISKPFQFTFAIVHPRLVFVVVLLNKVISFIYTSYTKSTVFSHRGAIPAPSH